MAAKLGTGTRFKKLKSKLARRGARNPRALAAWIGRRKYGSKRYAKLSKATRMHEALEQSVAALTQAKRILAAIG
jgi:hypothetical protein